MADHVFISYAREDQAFVLPLAERLRNGGVRVWLDQWNIPSGVNWRRAIDRAVYRCERFLIVLSPASIESDEVLGELQIALDEEKPVVPLLYQACLVPGILRLRQGVECRGRGAEDQSLLQEMRAALGVAATAVPQAGGTAGLSGTLSTRLNRAQPLDPRMEAAPAQFRLGGEELVRIPAGVFWMGSPEGEGGENEHPQHPLELPEFHIMRAPVTNAQYAAFIEAGGYRERKWWTEAGWAFKEKEGRTEPGLWGEAKWNQRDCPVVGVSWYEALAFARWAGGTLPSEAEWEKAAGWDQAKQRKRRYPWGDEWDAARCNTREEGPGCTTPVGHYSPRGDSAYQVADMAGNVWEWTRSQLAGYPYKGEDGREALAGADARVLRGGSWDFPFRYARCAYRFRDLPDYWLDLVGFRVSVSLAFSDF